MNRIFKISFLLLALQTMFVKAQDMHFTQFYSSPIYLNPAFTGANVCSRASMAYRNQWPGTKKAYESYLLSIDHYAYKQNVGLGLLCGVDDAGTGGLRTTIINPSIAYEAKITRAFAIRFGVQPGVIIKSISFNRLIFGDQLSRGGPTGGSTTTTIESPTQNRAFFDIGAGALFYTPRFWGGISMAHLNKPNESFYTAEEVRLPIKISIHGGTKILLNEDERDPDAKKSISVVAHYRGQAEFDQFDIGVYYSQFVFNAGIWYRGIPGLKAYKPGYQNDDAIAAVIGFQKERISIGYSYDLTISKLMGLTQGAHEVTLSFQMCDPKKRKVKRMLISCPKF